MSKKCSWCDYDMVEEKAWRCPDCDELVRIDDTVFHRITASPEVLAKKLVFWEQNPPESGWTSNIIRDVYRKYEEAIAATIEKLKEVAG